jgi:hypothetical protein
MASRAIFHSPHLGFVGVSYRVPLLTIWIAEAPECGWLSDIVYSASGRQTRSTRLKVTTQPKGAPEWPLRVLCHECRLYDGA